MKVIGKDIGTVLDRLYAEVESRVTVEAERELRFEAGAEGSFSNVIWRADGVVIQLHNGVPNKALPHVVGIALEHVRQRLERYPSLQRPAVDEADGPLLRSALRELVLAPAADHALKALTLDVQWEAEQRHQALKDLIRDHAEWDDPAESGHAFLVLLYARAAIEHPAELWPALDAAFQEALPRVTEHGRAVEEAVRRHGWTSPGACLESLLAARALLDLDALAPILDRRTGQTL
ncbi:MAG: hypothetical protein DWG79_00915 [Chloroflexi bacterium]|nr:hypothetical protein [Chloroflexota bacterium]MDA1146807.1 hypothetical protein [Chloroflexota bacterium]MQC82421.1 hypothetical protein [Chloroflexota bacterium]PKB56667.1 MAG: hypothetical protein BZY69_00500 [SAR202 cluster bacterium Casp-Chloro-G1]